MSEQEQVEDWGENGETYNKYIKTFTKQQADSIVQSLSKRIQKRETETIVDVGCGTGSFGLAYLHMFPNGFPWQTVIFMDVSQRMIDIAKRIILPLAMKIQCQTTFQFRVSDSISNITNDESDNIQIIVACFSIFHMPDDIKAVQNIQKIIQRNPNSVFVMTAWNHITVGDDHQHQLGDNVIALFNTTLQQLADECGLTSNKSPCFNWSDDSQAIDKLTELKFHNSFCRKSIHSFTLQNEQDVWEMIIHSLPYVNVDILDPEKVEKVKQHLFNSLKVHEDGVSLYSSCSIYFAYVHNINNGRDA